MRIIIRGGGDLASGVAVRLYRSGLVPIILELPQPLVVRRTVSFAEAIYSQEVQVEGVLAQRADGFEQADRLAQKEVIPVLVDAECQVLEMMHKKRLDPIILIDGRMIKRPPGYYLDAAEFIIGLGPGFSAGIDCHAVVETQRGHFLGKVIREGQALADTGVPEGEPARVLRAPADGVYQPFAAIGDHLEIGDPVALVDGVSIPATLRGVLRGSLHPGLSVHKGMKVGDIDPRDDPRLCHLVSDKALAVGGGVLEAILSRTELRMHLWV